MSEKQFDLGSRTQFEQRERQAAEFYDLVFDPDEQPWFVSDEASLWDIYAGEERHLIHRCQEHYGVWLRQAHFSLPFWQLLDYLAQHRIR